MGWGCRDLFWVFDMGWRLCVGTIYRPLRGFRHGLAYARWDYAGLLGVGPLRGFLRGMAYVRWDHTSLLRFSGMGWRMYVGPSCKVVQRLSARYVWRGFEAVILLGERWAGGDWLMIGRKMMIGIKCVIRKRG